MKNFKKQLFILSMVAMLTGCSQPKTIKVDFPTARGKAESILEISDENKELTTTYEASLNVLDSKSGVNLDNYTKYVTTISYTKKYISRSTFFKSSLEYKETPELNEEESQETYEAMAYVPNTGIITIAYNEEEEVTYYTVVANENSLDDLAKLNKKTIDECVEDYLNTYFATMYVANSSMRTELYGYKYLSAITSKNTEEEFVRKISEFSTDAISVSPSSSTYLVGTDRFEINLEGRSESTALNDEQKIKNTYEYKTNNIWDGCIATKLYEYCNLFIISTSFKDNSVSTLSSTRTTSSKTEFRSDNANFDLSKMVCITK